MNTYILVLLAFAAGIVGGIVFFGSLWLTVKKSMTYNRIAMLFIGSFVLRTAFILTIFYFVSGNNLQRLLACVLGFIVARAIVKQKIQTTNEKITTIKKEAGNET